MNILEYKGAGVVARSLALAIYVVPKLLNTIKCVPFIAISIKQRDMYGNNTHVRIPYI